MSMDLINFAFGAATGVAGNAVYDSIKVILGGSFGKLENYARNDDREKFELVLETLLESNDMIRQQLDDLYVRETGQKTVVNIEGDVKAEKGSVATGVISGGTIRIKNTFGSDER